MIQQATRFALIGAAYDSSASLGRPGSRFAPAAIRQSMKWIFNRVQGNKLYDVERRKIVDLSRIEFVDVGDPSLPAWDHQLVLQTLSQQIGQLLKDGYRVIVLGGDHSITNAGFMAVEWALGRRFGVIDLDTHLDLVLDSPTQGKWSGSSEIRRATEMASFPAANIVQVGVRGYNFPEHFDFIQSCGISHITATEFREMGARAAAELALSKATNGTEGLYLTVDIDVLDSAYSPGSGANEPGGLSSRELFDFVRVVAPFVDIMDIVEVNPAYDVNGMTSAVAARLVVDFITSGL